MKTKTNRAPLFNHGSPFTLGQRRRMEARKLAVWLAVRLNKIVPPGTVPDYARTLPPGYYWYRDSYLYGAAILRYKAPAPPLLPRYRVDTGSAIFSRVYCGPATDEDLIADGHDPAKYQPMPLDNNRRQYSKGENIGHALLLFAVVVGVVCLCYFKL